MSEVNEPQQSTIAEETYPPVPEAVAESRFLFVDVAAQRAKQLRRGALPRLQADVSELSVRGAPHRDSPHRLERVAMEEVRRGLVPTIAPPLREVRDEEQA